MAEQRSSSKTHIIHEWAAAEVEEARAHGEIGYLARILVQATLPHSDPKTASFERTNGALTLTIIAPPKIGLPYGGLPRLLLAWVTTEAVRTRERDLILGNTLSGFMAQLDLVPTGGRWGTIPRLRQQMRRLFASAISAYYSDQQMETLETVTVADRAVLWWDPKRPDQADLWQSTVTLSDPFFRAVIERPVPVDLAALKALKRSPLSLDVYAWLTHRLSYLRQPTTVPWEALQAQFGGDYERTRKFRENFLRALAKVHNVYPLARVEPTPAGLLLRPGPTHIPRLPGR